MNRNFMWHVALGGIAAVALLLVAGGPADAKPKQGKFNQNDCHLLGGEWEELWYIPGAGSVTECVTAGATGGYSVDTYDPFGYNVEQCDHTPDGPDTENEVIICE
jgi:hypothetical protein